MRRHSPIALALWLGVVLAGVAGCGGGTSKPPCMGATPVQLTVRNFLNWCSVSIEGATASSAAAQTVCVADGPVALTATANPTFKLGLWHHTAGDTGGGETGTVSGTTSDATVNAAGTSVCAWVCCPTAAAPVSDCPLADQCNVGPGPYTGP